jgi:hypothetical protein
MNSPGAIWRNPRARTWMNSLGAIWRNPRAVIWTHSCAATWMPLHAATLMSPLLRHAKHGEVRPGGSEQHVFCRF